MSQRIKLAHVEYVPKDLDDSTLYVSEKYHTAVHLCACGCRSKVVTPLRPTEWSFEEHQGKPSLRPSIGNWQLPCKSHYWILAGEVRWSNQWTAEQIEDGRLAEETRRAAHYEERTGGLGLWAQLWRWIKGLL
jgi:hypothetical protein